MEYGRAESPAFQRPALFPLSDSEIIDSVATAIAERVCTERCPVPELLAPFHEANYTSPEDEAPFAGTRKSVHSLLSCIANTGLEAKALVIAYCFIERIVDRLPSGEVRANAPVPASVAKAMIVATVILASKYHYDKGVRMRTLREDDMVCVSLGDGLVHFFARAEERVLYLLDWALRVGPDEYTETYNHLVAITAQRKKSARLAEDMRPVHHVASFPSELAALNAEVMRKRRHTPREPLSRANLPHADGSQGAPARLQTAGIQAPLIAVGEASPTSPSSSVSPGTPAAKVGRHYYDGLGADNSVSPLENASDLSSDCGLAHHVRDVV